MLDPIGIILMLNKSKPSETTFCNQPADWFPVLQFSELCICCLSCRAKPTHPSNHVHYSYVGFHWKKGKMHL